MNGEQFKALEVEQQVEYINGLLEQGDTVDNIRITLGIGKNYIRNSFKKGGYTRDKATGYYMKALATSENTNTTAINKKAKKKEKGTSNIKSLEAKVNGLEKQIEGIMAMLEANNNTNATSELNIKTFKGEKVARSYKVNIEVQKQFKAFCKAHSEYEVGDILANAMLEFMNKYK